LTGAPVEGSCLCGGVRYRVDWLAGEELVGRYQSSPGEIRTFCSRCAATLPRFAAGERPEGTPGALVLVVVLTVAAAAADAFRDYERQAAAVMARHGGRIERAVVVPGGETFREIHLVRFPGPEALAAYRADRALAALAAERAQVVLRTEVLTGADGPVYDALPCGDADGRTPRDPDGVR
jgi:hypothetical protein